MKQVIRTLGWATTIFWIILLLLALTAVYSAFQIRPVFGEPRAGASDGVATMSIPFSIANGGFYDIASLNLTTLVKDKSGVQIAANSTWLQLIPHGMNASTTHNMSIELSQMATQSTSYLLFNDSTLTMDIALKANYAKVVPVKISTNISMPWGAPLSNLTLGTIEVTPYNTTHVRITLPFSFENHSFFDLDGNMRLDLVTNAGRIVVTGATIINSPSNEAYRNAINLLTSSNLASVREARVYFETSLFSYGPVVIPFV